MSIFNHLFQYSMTVFMMCLHSARIFSRLNTLNSDRRSTRVFLNNQPIRFELCACVIPLDVLTDVYTWVSRIAAGPPYCLASSPSGKNFYFGSRVSTFFRGGVGVKFLRQSSLLINVSLSSTDSYIQYCSLMAVL